MKNVFAFVPPQHWFLTLLALVWSSVAFAQPSGCSGNDPGGNPVTNGLYAEYYAGYFNDNHAFFTTGPAPLQRVDAQVNFVNDASWGAILPPADGSLAYPERFSARYRGSLNVPVTGQYTFYLTSDDASFLWFDDATLDLPAQDSRAAIINGGTHGPITQQVTITLAAGLHNVLIHYGEDQYGNSLVWEWASADAGITRQPVPTSALCTRVQNLRQPPQSITYTPPTATISSGTAISSVVPVVNDGGLPVTGFAIANSASLPASITINPSTGVLTAAGTLPTGQYTVNVAVTNADGTSTFNSVFTFDILPPPPSGCAGTDPGGNAPAAGLYMELYTGYYGDNPAFFNANAPVISRVDPVIDFQSVGSWGNIVPPATGSVTDPDAFSARVRGSIRVDVPGFYTFYLTSDDGSFMWVDNAAIAATIQNSTALIKNGGLHGDNTVQAEIYLTPGLHNVLIHYGESAAGNTLQLEWSSVDAGITRQIVPRNVLCSVVQPLRFPPLALTYSPATLSMVSGVARSSVAPVVDANGHGPITRFILGNAAALPSGIRVNSATGVLTADATVATGTYAVSVIATNAEGATQFSNAFTFVVTPTPPPNCTGTDPRGQPVTASLLGEYYVGYFDDEPNNQAYFSSRTPQMMRQEASINFVSPTTWGNLLPIAQGTADDPDYFSLRLRGSVYVATAGTYTFYLTSDDASYLWVDNAALLSPPVTADALINNGTGHSPITKQNSVYLSAGLHNVLIHYGEFNGGNTLKLEWSSADAGVALQLVPTTSFCSATQAVRPLPISLTRFAGRSINTGVELTWQTAQERDNSHFEVERSADGRSYATLGRVAGNGNSSNPRSYRYLDTEALAGSGYYRLRQVDFDGTATYYGPVAVQTARGGRLEATVFPNPSRGDFVLRLSEPVAAATQLHIVDMRGRRVYEQLLPKGTREQLVPDPKLPKGVYALRLLAPGVSTTLRLVVE
ncbi:PA14 domain-containing protein [Hymenobacter koreensis]